MKSTPNQLIESQVTCVFERNNNDGTDNWKGELLAIYEDPKDALEHIELDKNQDLFWETWQVKERRISS